MVTRIEKMLEILNRGEYTLKTYATGWCSCGESNCEHLKRANESNLYALMTTEQIKELNNGNTQKEQT